MISPELLRRFPFFAGLGEEHLREVAMIAQEVSYPANTVISREGEQASHLFVLVEGEVELLYSGGEGAAVDSYVGSIVQGETFGISSMVEPFRLTASTRTEGPVKAIQIDAQALRAMCEADYYIGYVLMKHLAQALTERLHAARIQLAVSKPI